MRRNNQYTFESRVRFSEVNPTRRITLPAIINYFQDCSTFQSEGFGMGLKYCEEKKRAWFLSSWQIVVDKYPEMGDKISVNTWATDFRGLFGDRNFCMEDENGQILAKANSLWVYMDLAKGRPVKPLPEEIEQYGKGEPLDMEFASRKIDLPEIIEKKEPIRVMSYHIDTNGHVNNGQYVQMALEYIDETMPIHQLRVEYKKSAVYNDVMIPAVAKEEGRTVVVLMDESEKPYVVLEFC